MARSGLFVKLDTNFPDDDRIEEVGFAGAGLYAMALCLAKRLNEDGRISRSKLHRLGADNDLIDLCVTAQLFTEDGTGLWISAWLNYNECVSSIEQRRSEDASRKRVTRGKRPAGRADTMSKRPTRRPTGRADLVEEEEEEEEEITPLSLQAVDQGTATAPQGPSAEADAGRNDPVREVFDAWVTATGRTGRHPRLSTERRKLIRARLKDYPSEDLIDAVRGWKHSPHHRGENDRHTTYNDLELLLRNAKQVETFRDLQRQKRSPTLGPQERYA